MNNKILFLNGNSSIEFYNNERNKYKNVTATNIFKSDKLFIIALRRLVMALRLPGLSILFDGWKRNIIEYDLFIISASIYSSEIAKYIRKRTDKRIINWYWNPVTTDIEPDRIIVDNCECWSFDQEDCRRYGINYIPTYYFSGIQLPKNEIISDIYFMGADKGRIYKLLELKQIFEDQGLKVEFHITESSNSEKIENYTFKPRILYNQVLEGISKCNAVLDLAQNGQVGMSQRPMEALFYNKKLITNDVNICTYDFYDKNNIFILGKDDIASIKKFINSPYVAVDKNIVEKYDFGNWLAQIQN